MMCKFYNFFDKRFKLSVVSWNIIHDHPFLMDTMTWSLNDSWHGELRAMDELWIITHGCLTWYSVLNEKDYYLGTNQKVVKIISVRIWTRYNNDNGRHGMIMPSSMTAMTWSGYIPWWACHDLAMIMPCWILDHGCQPWHTVILK